MGLRSAVVLACTAAFCGSAITHAQAPAGSPRTASSAPDWDAVQTQLVARGAGGLRRNPVAMRQLIPDTFRASPQLNETPNVPVLVPLFAGASGRSFAPVTMGDPATGARALSPAQPTTLVFPESDTYSATIQLGGGAVVTVSGSRVAQVLDRNDSAARSLMGEARGIAVRTYQMADVVVEQTETGHSISFSRFGVSYHLDIACASPFADARCSDPDYVRELANSMGLVGDPPAKP